MTDKEQIIIHGVNVSECKEYIWALSHVCNLVNGRTDKFECNYYPNCYFKQLARKTQECEELKKRATIAEDNFACEVQARLYHQNEWLKFSKECEELKKQLETSEEWRIKAESLNEKLELRNACYRKALEEIEKIVSKNYYDDTWADISIKLDDILNIINNAKGEGKCQ